MLPKSFWICFGCAAVLAVTTFIILGSPVVLAYVLGGASGVIFTMLVAFDGKSVILSGFKPTAKKLWRQFGSFSAVSIVLLIGVFQVINSARILYVNAIMGTPLSSYEFIDVSIGLVIFGFSLFLAEKINRHYPSV